MPVTSVSTCLLKEAYDIVLAQWPDVIEPGQKSFHLGGACNMRGLNDIHESVENWISASTFRPEIETVISTVEHYVFVSIHNALKDVTRLSKADLDFDAFASRFDGHPNFQVARHSQT